MLSERMRYGPGHEHIWQQMWETSVPVPVSRQTRSFDPVQESESFLLHGDIITARSLSPNACRRDLNKFVCFRDRIARASVVSDLTSGFRALKNLRSCETRAIALLDDALAESQVTFPAAGRSKQQHVNDHKRLKQQLQVAFEMALDACWKLVRSLEAGEALVTKAMALLHYFLVSNEEQRHLPL
ncbi:unnamed protein product [Peronospora belbahrii]|uniref:Rab3GAP catalytic subunit conserved domain-containing protein n=1 Tax=Peronospora belbahrii TaxID=622444 RepID=A0ABN8D193_9STRA|nr:unnamed protein product [Peronospora belbahrii]